MGKMHYVVSNSTKSNLIAKLLDRAATGTDAHRCAGGDVRLSSFDAPLACSGWRGGERRLAHAAPLEMTWGGHRLRSGWRGGAEGQSAPAAFGRAGV